MRARAASSGPRIAQVRLARGGAEHGAGARAHAAFTSRTSSSTVRSNSSVDVGFQQPTRYEFPAEHGIHIRSYVIESSFATIRHRTDRTKGCLTSDGMLAMIYKLGQSAERSWRRLRGFEWLAKVVEGVKSGDGIEVKMQTRVKPNQPNTIAA